ncbi:MAG TPA: PRC-barrel domain-containing protein [Pilimelia sp.]|nr:PRC-barrel domain-containing protein [Pilimelia sp.]
MQPFVPWVWRDPAFAGGHVGAEEERREDVPDSAEADKERAGSDLTGYDVEATDGKIGSVDEASHEAGAGYLVVDTGPWIFGRKVLLPAGTVGQVDHAERKIYVDRTKEQVKNSPEYDPDTFGKPDYRDRVGSYYEESYRTTPPLM